MLNINMFGLKIEYILYILCIDALYHINMHNFYQAHIFQNHVWTRCA
jgi:hypothetical protein